MRIKNMFIQLAYRQKILSATKTNYRVNSINRFELHYILVLKVLTVLSTMINTSLSYLSHSNCRNMPTPTRITDDHTYLHQQDYKTKISYKTTTNKYKPAKGRKQHTTRVSENAKHSYTHERTQHFRDTGYVNLRPFPRANNKSNITLFQACQIKHRIE